MNKFFSVLVVLIWITSLKAQELSTGHLNVSNLLFYEGVLFKSKASDDNQRFVTIEMCDLTYSKLKWAGLEINSKMYHQMKLRNHDILDSTNFFTYKFNNDSGCIDTVLLEFEINIPIYLNGERVSINGQGTVLSKIPLGKIESIKRKRFLFGDGKVEIITSND